MKKLRDYKHLLNDNAIKFVETWVSAKWDADVYFVHSESEESSWYEVCMSAKDLYGTQAKCNYYGAHCLSLSKATSGGAKSTFFGDIRHFVKESGARIAYRHNHTYRGMYCDDPWFNYEYCQRVRTWLNYRYGFNL